MPSTGDVQVWQALDINLTDGTSVCSIYASRYEKQDNYNKVKYCLHSLSVFVFGCKDTKKATDCTDFMEYFVSLHSKPINRT